MSSVRGKVLEHAREQMEKEASFLPGKGMLAASPVAKKILPKFGRKGQRAMKASQMAGEAAAKSKQIAARKKHLLGVVRRGGKKAAPVATEVAGKAKKPLGKRVKRGLVLGGLGLAGAATLTGAASAGKAESSRPMAPPNQLPPGY